MFRFLAILALLLVTFTSEGSLPRQAALSRLDYTALVNNWGGTLDAGTLTVSGVTPLPASEVKVNGQTAQRYEDFTFASPGHAVSANNSFTLSAKDIYGAVTNTTLSVSLPASVSITYDQNGNLTSDGVRSLSYNALNQLTTNWLTGAWKMEHVYDGLSRRRVTREYSWQGNDWVKTNETRYIYDGRVVIQERTAANGLQVSFTRGLDLSGSLQGAGGIGGLLARTDHASSSSYFYHADGAGNVTALSDARGRIAARYLYNPFGRLTAKWGPMADVNRYQFSSKESDYLSGLSYYGYRFYDPTLQRWLTRDPLGEAGGINLYGFVGNNPVIKGDPFGKEITYFYGDNSFGYVEGGVPYLQGDTVGENLAAGLYNAIPLVNNLAEQVLKPIDLLMDALGDLAEQQFGPMVGDGTRNVLAVLPFLFSKKCPKTWEYQFADRAWFEDINAYRDLKASIRDKGLMNPVIEYTVIDGKKYVLKGNGRLSVAEDLGIADQLTFKQVDLPFSGYNTPADVLEEANNIIYNIPRGSK